MFRFSGGPVLSYTHMGHGLLRHIGLIVRSNAVSIVDLIGCLSLNSHRRKGLPAKMRSPGGGASGV